MFGKTWFIVGVPINRVHLAFWTINQLPQRLAVVLQHPVGLHRWITMSDWNFVMRLGILFRIEFVIPARQFCAYLELEHHFVSGNCAFVRGFTDMNLGRVSFTLHLTRNWWRIPKQAIARHLLTNHAGYNWARVNTASNLTQHGVHLNEAQHTLIGPLLSGLMTWRDSHCMPIAMLSTFSAWSSSSLGTPATAIYASPTCNTCFVYSTREKVIFTHGLNFVQVVEANKSVKTIVQVVEQLDNLVRRATAADWREWDNVREDNRAGVELTGWHSCACTRWYVNNLSDSDYRSAKHQQPLQAATVLVNH